MADLDKKTAAKELGVSVRTVDRLRDLGELTWHPVGAKVLIPEAAIAAYRQRQNEKAAGLQRLRKHKAFIWIADGVVVDDAW